MTLSVRASMARRHGAPHLQIPLPPFVFLVAALGLGAAVVHPELIRIVLLVALLPAIIGLGLWSPNGLLYGMVVWLVALGLLRRLIDTTATPTAGGFGDPLLLVEPMIMVVLTSIAARKGAFRNRTRLAKAVFLLNILAVLEVVNPLQGSLLVGAAGLLFLLVPTLAFWIGRALIDDRILRRLFVLLGCLAVPSVLYGVYQQFVGFPSWDEAWVRLVSTTGYIALNVNGVVRSFGTFSASSEYVTFLAIGIVMCGAAMVKPSIAPGAIIVGGLLAFGVFYDSTRSVLLLTVLALALMVAARRGFRPTAALATGVVGVVLLFVLARAAVPTAPTAGASAALAAHQLGGLANPFNSQDSTVSIHFSEVTHGLISTLKVPFGHGTGSISLASTAFGGNSQGTELDPSNFGVALGIPGLVAYLIVVWRGFGESYRMAAKERTWWTLGALGLLAVTLFQWSNGGQYAVAWLPWLVLGWLDQKATANSKMSVDSRVLEAEDASKRPPPARRPSIATTSSFSRTQLNDGGPPPRIPGLGG